MKGEALIERREAAVARGVATVHPIFAERARGVRLRDVDGREYLDFTGGIGVLNVGHLHPRVVAAVTEQLEHFSHTCFQVAMYEGYVALAERLNELAPGEFAKKIDRAHHGGGGGGERDQDGARLHRAGPPSSPSPTASTAAP